MPVIRITQLQDLVEMSDGEKGAAATPGPEKLVKFANPNQVGAMFPALQSRCSIQKGLLTKALNSSKVQKFKGRVLSGNQREYLYPNQKKEGRDLCWSGE